MKFTINIPVTRKRTKHGYYVVRRGDRGPGDRVFFMHRKEALRNLKALIHWRTSDILLITARDLAKKTKSKPPA